MNDFIVTQNVGTYTLLNSRVKSEINIGRFPRNVFLRTCAGIYNLLLIDCRLILTIFLGKQNNKHYNFGFNRLEREIFDVDALHIYHSTHLTIL